MVQDVQLINAFFQPYVLIADDGRLLATNLADFKLIGLMDDPADATVTPPLTPWLEGLSAAFAAQAHAFWLAFKHQPTREKQLETFVTDYGAYPCYWHRVGQQSDLRASLLVIVLTSTMNQQLRPSAKLGSVAMSEKQYLLEARIAATQRDLSHSIHTLEALQEELHTTTEELMASNEELISSNEELQVMNEELLRLNDRHQQKFEDLVQLHNQFEGALAAYDIPILFIDAGGLIRRFTPGVKQLFAITEGDLGRPLNDINHVFECQNLIELLEICRLQGRPVQEMVTKNQQAWLMTINKNNVEEGWILTFVATSHYEKKRHLQSILDALPQHVALLSESGTILYTNNAWRRFAQANGVKNPDYTGIGQNYLAACRVPDNYPDPSARRCYYQLAQLLDDKLDRFSMIYPCHSPLERRWFSLQVVRISGVSKVKAVVSHHNLSAIL